MKKIKHSRLFYQYLLSYIFILFVPLVVLSIFIYSYVLNILKDEIYVNNKNTLQKAKDTIESQMQNVTSLEHKVYLGESLEGFQLQKDTIMAINAQQTLEDYCQINPFLLDMAYYQEDDAYIITSGSSCRKEDFWSKMYLYEEWGYEQFLEELKQNDRTFFVEAQNVSNGTNDLGRIVTLVIPLSGKSERCVIMLIDESFFANVMPQTDVEEEVSAIVSVDGRIIVSRGEQSLMDAVYDSVYEDKNINEVTIHGNKYLRTQIYSEDYQWNYESLVLISRIEEKVFCVRLMMTVVCMFVCIAGAVGIIYFMKRNYIPIHSLEITSNKILKNEEQRNEIDHVKAVLEYLDQQNKKLRADEEVKNLALKESFLSKWMSGQYENEEQLREQANKVGILLNRSIYQAAIIRVSHFLPEQEQAIKNALVVSVFPDVDVFLKVQPETQRILLVVGFDEDKEAHIDKYYSKALDVLQKNIEVESCLAMGEQVKQALLLKDSYMGASKALEYRLILYEQKIIRYEEVMSRENGTLDIKPNELGSYIKNKDIEGLEKFLAAALDEIKQKNVHIRRIRMQCNDFIYALERTIEAVNRDYFIENPLYYDISRVLQYDNFYELIEIIHIIGCDIIDHLNEFSGRTIVDELVRYILDHCYSADFSTTAMAEEFKMSLPYLSQYFKKHMGMNLLDYVTERKIGKAKELLKDTDMAIKDISEQVGYYSVNSFNRRFKQVTGYTPGEWRKEK